MFNAGHARLKSIGPVLAKVIVSENIAAMRPAKPFGPVTETRESRLHVGIIFLNKQHT
jgi:hypothetical protein